MTASPSAPPCRATSCPLTPSPSRPNCWWPSCAPRLMTQLCVTLPSEDTGQELLLLCTLSSWRPTLSVLSLVRARRPSSPPQPVTNAPAQSVPLLMPYAMPTLAGLLRERAAQFCCDLSTEGVCC